MTLACLVVGLVACGGDDDGGGGRRCEIITDCASDERCVGGFCVAAPDRDAGEDAGEEDAGEADAARDVGTDTAVEDAGEDAGGGLTCPGPGGPTEEPLVLYNFDDGDTVAALVDQAPNLPDVPMVGTGDMTVVDGHVDIRAGRYLASQAASDALTAALVAQGAATIEVWVRAADMVIEESSGPERIVTLSQDFANRAFTIGQDEDLLAVRFRSDQTNTNGTNCRLTFDAGPGPFDGGPPSGTRSTIEAPIFNDTTSLRHIALVIDDSVGEPRVYVDGVEMTGSYPCMPAMVNWPFGENRLALGDESNDDDRQWEGRIYRVAIYPRAMTPAEITCWHDAGVAAPVFR